MGRCAAETQALVDAFSSNKCKLYTAYISRAYDLTQTVHAWLQEGRVGDTLQSVSYQLVGMGGARDMDTNDLPWRLQAAQSGGGLLLDVGCHVLDRLDYLLGPLTNVDGKAENRKSPQQPVEDYVHLTASIGDSRWTAPNCQGARVECTWDFADSGGNGPKDELILTGNQGSIRLAAMQPAGPVRLYDLQGTLVDEARFDMPQHTAQQMIQAVTDDLRGIQPKPDFLSYGENAVRTSQVMDTVLRSYYGNRDTGYWEDMDAWPGRSASK